MKDATAELRGQAQSRAAIYGFLAWLFLEEPDCDFVTRLLSDDVQDGIRSLASGAAAGSKLIAGLQEMLSYFTGNGSRSVEDTCLALAVERTRLMRGVARHYGPPPPYESLYRSPKVSGEASVLVEVAEFYREVHVELPARRVDRIDYLGLELDLMRLLCEEESHCWDQGDAEAVAGFAMLQQRFLREHLLLWAPRFCESMLTQPTAGFYRGVARLLLGFLEDEETIEVERLSESQVLSWVIRTGTRKVR